MAHNCRLGHPQRIKGPWDWSLVCHSVGTRLGPRGETQLNLRTPPEAPTSRVMPPVSPSSVYTPCHRHGRGQVQLRRPRLAGALTAGR